MRGSLAAGEGRGFALIGTSGRHPTCKNTLTLPVANVLVCEPASDSMGGASGSIQSWHNALITPPALPLLLGCWTIIFRAFIDSIVGGNYGVGGIIPGLETTRILRGLNRGRTARPNIGVDAVSLTVTQSSPCWGFAVVERLAEGQYGLLMVRDHLRPWRPTAE